MISGNTDRHLYEIRGGGGEHGKNEEVQQKYRNLKKKKKKSQNELLELKNSLKENHNREHQKQT